MLKSLSAAWATVILLWASAASWAQDTLPESVFRDYDHMRSVLDEGMMERNISTVMRAFGASDEMTKEELSDLETHVRSIFGTPFTDVDVMKSVKLGPNWTQELYAFHSGTSYIYAMVLFHTREDDLVAVNFKFNTNPLPLLKDF